MTKILVRHNESEPELEISLYKGREKIAYLGISYITLYGKEYGAVDLIWVSSEHQRQGLGSLLYDTAVTHLC